MSVELVKKEILRFLSTPEPEVICLTGHWGVGKTYAWNRYLSDCKDAKNVALERYSYVSLFGINSLEELKFSLFQSSVRASDIGATIDLQSIESNLVGSIGAAGKKGAKNLLGLAQQTPFLRNYLGGIAPVWFAAVTRTIVCIDDLERRGKELSVRDVLGLINNLKELKKCKVCLILNDEALESEEDEFRKYLEKVVDATLKFEPSAADSILIALPQDSQSSKWLAEFCVKLGISNIRVIKKIERSLKQVEPILATFHPAILQQAAHSMTLLGWSIFEPTKAPSLEYLKKKSAGGLLPADKGKQIPEREAAWNAQMGAYQFGSIDEFDLALLRGIQNGYFDPVAVEKYATELDKKIKAGNLGADFESAWRMYHDSFEDNQDEVLDSIHSSFLKGANYVSPMNMSSTVSMFKSLGRPEQAAEMLKHYVDARGSETSVFDLGNYPFADSVNDPDVVKAFAKKFASFKHEMDPEDTLIRIAETHSWNPQDVTLLSSLTIEDYRTIFKGRHGADLRKIINACLMFNNVSDPSGNYQAVANKAREALKLIGKESPINARRVNAYGVTVDPVPDTKSCSDDKANVQDDHPPK